MDYELLLPATASHRALWCSNLCMSQPKVGPLGCVSRSTLTASSTQLKSAFLKHALRRCIRRLATVCRLPCNEFVCGDPSMAAGLTVSRLRRMGFFLDRNPHQSLRQRCLSIRLYGFCLLIRWLRHFHCAAVSVSSHTAGILLRTGRHIDRPHDVVPV